jgi:RNA polymerase sigma factor (sigma-70 family)
MESQNSLADSLSELLEVAPQTAEEIWREFFPRMIRLAKKRLADLPNRMCDEDDVVQSAMNSFFRGQAAGKFEQLDSKDEMWRLLATITARKTIKHRRMHYSKKRGGGVVRGESIFGTLATDDQSASAGLAGMRDARTTPETTEEILRTCDSLLTMLPDEKYRRTAVLRLEGYSNAEIAAEMNCSVARTKQRLQRIREIWQDVEL